MSFQNYKTFCEKGKSHEGKEIIMICMNSECDARRLCCFTCIDEIHRKHELISLYKFDRMLEVLRRKLQPEMTAIILSLLKQFEDSLNKRIDKSLHNFIAHMEKCRNEMKSNISHIRDSINLNFSSSDLQSLYENFTNQKEAQNQSFKDPEVAANTLKLAQINFEKQIVESQKYYLKGIDEINKANNKLKQIIKVGASKKKFFSKIFKAPSILVNENSDEARRFQGAGGYPIVVIEQSITQASNSVNILIKEQPGNKGLWMGVCVLDIVKNFNFASCYGIGKGTWAIDQVGATHQSAYSWSHHDSNYNSQPKVGWQYYTGDTINLRVDLGKGTIIFTKQNNSYEMPIKTDIGDLYFFVGCTHINDVLAIV